MADDITPQSLCAIPEPLYAMTERLSQWGRRPEWLIVLTRWLARYRGLQALLVDWDEQPAMQVLELLRQWSASPSNHELAQRLACLDFLQWLLTELARAARVPTEQPRP